MDFDPKLEGVTKCNSFYRVKLVEGRKLNQEEGIQFWDTFGIKAVVFLNSCPKLIDVLI